MNRKAVSIIILCLMLLSTLPLSFHTTGGENEKTVKGPKASGGEVSDVKIVYNDTYKTINYTCWTSGTPSYSKWNGTSYNDLNTVKNAGVIRRNTTFNVTATGISSANKIKILGPCDVGEPRPNITTWSPQYDSTPDPDVWNFTVPSNAPVGDYQVYLNESYCTVYVIFDVFLTKTPSGMTENEFSGWAYNESNDAANYTICQYVGTEAVGKCYTFRERVTELVCSSMGGSTTTEYQAAIKLYGIVNARISWKGVAGSPAYDTEAILNENTGLTISYAKKIALQTGDTLPNGMVTQRNCANFGIFTPALIKSIGIPARTFNSGDGESVVDPNMWGWGDFDNTCQAYIEYPDMSMGPYYDDHSKRWIMIYSNDALEGDGGIGTQNSNGEGSIGTLQDLYFHARMLDIVPCTKADETNTWEWNGGDPAATAGWSVIDLGATDEIPSGLADPGAATHTGLPEVNLTTSDYGYLKGDLGCGDRDFFRVNVTGKSFVDIGFTEGADYAQIYVNNTTTGSNEPDFAPNGALKTAYYSSLVWGDDKCTATVPTGVNWFYIMIDNAKEFQYADDYAQDGHGATTYHAMAETHHYILGIGKCPPNVTVKSPNGNEVLIGGKSYNITWNATIINSSRLSSNCINISYSTDGGENWNTIDGAQGLSNIGYYIWSILNKVNSDSVKINITCNTTDGKTGYDISDNSFTIRGSTPFRELSSGTGNATGDRFGWNVSYAGDLNNDGYDDIVVGAPYVTYNSVSECGAVYIFFGYSNISLGNLTATYANVSIYGTIADAHFGWSVSDAGKVDEASGGYDDIIIGEPDNGNGKAYLFFGRSTWNNTYNTTEANVTLAGEGANDRFGFSVSGAGDVNNDNYDDVVIGAYANGTDKGKAYIYYGGAVGAPTDSTVYVSSNVTTYGTIDGFDNAKVEDGNYATLTEELVSGMTLFYETFPTASAAWDGTGQDNPGWTVIQGSADADDIQVTDNAVITSGDTPSGLNYLEFFDCDDAFGSGYDLAWVGIDLSGYTGVVISYYWQLDDTDAGEGVMAEYSTDSTNGVDGTWPDIASHLGTTPHDVWTQQTFNLDDAACVANFKLRFSGYMGATTEQAWIDDVKINGSCYKMDIEFNTTSVVEAANYYLQLNYNVTSGGNFDVFVYNGATWDDIGDLTSTIRWTGLQIALNSNHRLGNGYVRVRYVAMTTTQDKLYIEYHRIRSYGTLGAPFTSSNVTLTGENANDKFGFSVSRAGDVNKDGYGDVVVGAPGYDNSRGSAYVFYGGGWLTGTHTVGSTITYNYSSGAGTNKWAYETSGLTSSKPSSGPEITAEIAIGSYTAIESSNDVRETTAIDASTYSAQRFRIILDEKPESITRIYIEWEGYADGGYVQIMYIWNFAISDWVALSWGLFGSDSRATWDFTSNFASYINSTNTITFAVTSTTGAVAATLYTDYVKVVVESNEANLTRIGENQGDKFGFSVSNLGDTNGDSIDDFIVGAPEYSGGKGRAYIYEGIYCLDRRDVYTIVNQPGDNGDHWVGKDTELRSGAATTNYGTVDRFWVGYYDALGYYYERSLLQFDLSTIPLGANIVKAELKLCQRGSDGTADVYIHAHRVTRYWNENTATWNTYDGTNSWTTLGGDYETGNIECNTTVPVALTNWSSWDITNLTRCWVNGTVKNYGLLLKKDVESGTDDRAFVSADMTSDHSKAPKLELTIRKNADLTITGDKAGDKFGYSVSGKDLNNDSYSDIIVGAPYKDNGTNTDAGAVYVFFGNTTMPSATNASHADNETFGNETNLTLGFSVSYADLNNDGYNDIIAGAYNYSSDQGKVYALTCRRATLTVSNWTDKAYGKTPAPGENDVLMLNMTLNASECTIRVTNIRVNLTGENAADGDISKVRLIYDADWSGTINAGDEQLGEESFPISGKSLNFTLSFDVSYGTPKHLLLFYNISSGATVGHYVGANLTDYSFISVVRPDNVSNYKFPVNSTNVLITSAVDTLTVSGISVSPEFVNQGNTNITMLNITLSSDNGGDGTVNVTSINISLTGTGTSTNISGVTIYNDTDGSGGLSTGDTQLNTTRTFTDSYVLFGYLNFNVNYGCNAYIFVVYNISSTAIIDSTVGANLTNETKITVDTTNGDTVGSFATIWSNNSTIKKKITYEILNETGVLQTGDWKLWGNWTADPGYIEVNGTNWLRVRNTNGSNPNQQFIVDFTDTYFENATTGGSITIDGNIWFWYFNTTSSTETPNNWIGGGNAIVGVNETDYIEANGAYKFTFNTVGEYIWILYRIEKIPEICPDGEYTASFTVTVV